MKNQWEIGPGREGEPVLYIDNYPVAEVHDEERLRALLSLNERYAQKLEIAEKALEITLPAMESMNAEIDLEFGYVGVKEPEQITRVREALKAIRE